MAKPEGEIENEDPRFNETMWKIERVTYAVIGLVIAAALAGLLGSGPLSSATAGEPGGPVWVEYDRFLHADTPARVRVHLKPGAGEARVRLWVSQAFHEAFEVHRVSPEAESVESAGDGLVYVIRAKPGAPEAVVTFDLEARSADPVRGEVGPEAGPRVRLRQFVYP